MLFFLRFFSSLCLYGLLYVYVVISVFNFVISVLYVVT